LTAHKERFRDEGPLKNKINARLFSFLNIKLSPGDCMAANLTATNSILSQQTLVFVAYVAVLNRDAQISGACRPGRLNFAQCGLIFSGYLQQVFFFADKTQAERTTLQDGLQVTPELTVINTELALCHPSGANNLDTTRRLLKKIVIPLFAKVCANKSMGH
jgi:hypothetical protein